MCEFRQETNSINPLVHNVDPQGPKVRVSATVWVGGLNSQNLGPRAYSIFITWGS